MVPYGIHLRLIIYRHPVYQRHRLCFCLTLCYNKINDLRPCRLTSPLGIDKVFLDSCKEVSKALSLSSSHSSTYKLVELNLDKDKEAVVSDAERLSVFYANAAYDFYGTPSGALCVYKNGNAWPVRTGLESQRIIREASGVHGHPMQVTWFELGKRVYTLLDDMNVPWTSIDPLAFAEAGKIRFSNLLIWIGVETKSLIYELANTAAAAVTNLLTQAGFSDFEVGFRESVVTRSFACPKMLSFDPLNDSVPELRKPFTPTLGLSIAPFKTPHYEGTGTLYLRESKDSNCVFLLTCAHVARPPPVHPSTGPVRKATSIPREQVIALGSSGYTDALKSMMCTIGDQNCSIKDWRTVLRRLGKPQEGESANITKRRVEHLALVEKARENISEINKLHNKILKQWTIPEQRVIGEAVHVEPIGVNVAPHGFTRGWALIKLYNEKFDWTTFKGNEVYIGGNLSSLDYGKVLFPQPEDQADYEYPEDGLLQAFGVIQADEIHNPKQLDTNGEQCLLVIKNGLRTGTTIGRVTGMESFTRTIDEHGIKETSMEIAVLPYGNANGPFSASGDSGSIVLDRNGRILGMLNGGAGSTNRTDVTYLTPYWYIEQEIKKYFPDSFLYDVVL
ncbi:hypothetical protein FRC19_011436 [Serendipita sp. 401]|nr:hypothetical protein FRC19_011436 [Serendipita sp. 401]